MKIDGKVAIITGGAQGIGKSQAEAILAKGGKVCIADVLEEVGNQTAAELKAKYGESNVIFLRCDVTKKTDLENVFSTTKSEFGKIDIVVNNAGGVTEADFEYTIQRNLVGSYRGTDLGFKYMGQNNGGEGGVVINVASIAGLMAFPAMPSYTASKFGVVGMTKALGSAEHLNDTGVRVNVICPWFVDTKLASGDMVKSAAFNHIMQKFYDDNLHTLIQPETVAKCTVDLIEDNSKNGAVMEVQQASNIVDVQLRQLPQTSE